MLASEPYVHTRFRADTPIESGDFDQFGVVFDRVDGHHAIFGALVHPQPFESVEARKWGWTKRDLVLEVLDRQRRFISSLYRVDPAMPSPNPDLKTIALRFLRRPDSDGIDVVLLGKVFGTTMDQARAVALGWWQEITALFSYDYELVPILSHEEFQEFSGSAGLDADDFFVGMAEIRRHEFFIPQPRETVVTEGDYLVLPFTWHPYAMEQVWRAMAQLPCESLVSVTLRPTYLYEAEEMHLNQLRVDAEQKVLSAQGILSVQAKLAERLYARYLNRLLRPFLMRIQIAAEERGLATLARAMGTSLTSVPMTGSQSEQGAVSANYDIAEPTSKEYARARENLLALEFDDWGRDQAASPYRRFRYLFDSAEAHCAFRLPFLPTGGLPGVQLMQ
jgi:hypothetical protein